MPLPVSDLLSLAEVVRFVVDATGEDQIHVANTLREAGITGAISATGCLHLSAHRNLVPYFAHPVLSSRQNVPAEAWSGPIDWRESRVGRYDLVRITRSEIRRWLATAERQSRAVEPYADRPQATPGELAEVHGLTEPSGARSNRAAATDEQASRLASEQSVQRRVTKFETVRQHIALSYPKGIPADVTDKVIARATGASERTVRRARHSAMQVPKG
jgi:hypothetical protein